MDTKLRFDKYADGLVPAIVQDAASGEVLMLGFMNEAALAKTHDTGLVTFYSRSRQELWTKGETSGNFLRVDSIRSDCDEDTLLITVTPSGPVCHTGARTCFDGGDAKPPRSNRNILFDLERIILDRRGNPTEGSYTSKLFARGINKIAQKVGEEAVELVIEAKDENVELFRSEAADLLFHLLVLMRARDIDLDDILSVLDDRKR